MSGGGGGGDNKMAMVTATMAAAAMAMAMATASTTAAVAMLTMKTETTTVVTACESTLLNVRNEALPFLGLHLIISSRASMLEKLGLQFLMGRLHPNMMGQQRLQ